MLLYSTYLRNSLINIRLGANITGNAKLEGWNVAGGSYAVALIFYEPYANIMSRYLDGGYFPCRHVD